MIADVVTAVVDWVLESQLPETFAEYPEMLVYGAVEEIMLTSPTSQSDVVREYGREAATVLSGSPFVWTQADAVLLEAVKKDDRFREFMTRTFPSSVCTRFYGASVKVLGTQPTSIPVW